MKTIATALGLAILYVALVSSVPARTETIVLQDQDRDVIREWVYVNHKGCPPGTMMKKTQRYFGLVKPYHNCIPSSDAKVIIYQPGATIPSTVTYTELPTTVVSKLPAPPEGETYVTTDTGVYVVNPQTRTVVETVNLWGDVE